MQALFQIMTENSLFLIDYFHPFQAVVDCGALDALVICLEEFDPGVKEAAAWALGYIARHNAGKIQLFQSLQCSSFFISAAG